MTPIPNTPSLPAMPPLPNPALSSRRLMQVLMGGAGLVLLGGGGMLVGLNSKLAGLQAQAQQKQQQVSSSEQVTRRYQQTQAAYDETQSRIKFLETSVSAKSYVPTLLGQLQSLAAQTHLTVTAVRPVASPPPPPPVKKTEASADADGAAGSKKAAAPPPYDTMQVSVDVTGTYANTATFLYSLTRFPKILAVVGAQMHPAGNASGPAAAPGAKPAASAAPLITTNLQLIAFVFPDGPDTALDTASAAPVPVVNAAPAPAALTPAAIGAISPAAGHVAAGAAKDAHAASLQTGQLSTL